MRKRSVLHLFEGYGIELEYMIVDRATLDVRPIADRVLDSGAGIDVEVERGPVAWSNELALHVIELKTNGPARALGGLGQMFQASIAELGGLLAPLGARLLPSGMHPWMDPARELVLWPHENDAIYRAFDRIFDCRGHGWANLQSVHINLPFAGDAEFARLHAAIRLVLPILPALAASSPFLEGRKTGVADTRLEVYRNNAERVPSVTGHVIPERVSGRSEYERELLGRIYRDLAPLDPEGVLRYEWVNARGAIARFDRSSIEIRLLDVQECPAADLAVVAGVVWLTKSLVDERFGSFAAQQRWDEQKLADILLATIRDGDSAMVCDPAYLAALGQPGERELSARELWTRLLSSALDEQANGELERFLELYRVHGNLSRRISSAVGARGTRERLHGVYEALADCLSEGRLFHIPG